MGITILQPRFIKPFSRGQVTLPKEYREHLDIDEKTWLKVLLRGKRIIIQKVTESEDARRTKPKLTGKKYLDLLLKIKGGWFVEKEIKEIREEVERRLKKNEKSFA